MWSSLSAWYKLRWRQCGFRGPGFGGINMSSVASLVSSVLRQCGISLVHQNQSGIIVVISISVVSSALRQRGCRVPIILCIMVVTTTSVVSFVLWQRVCRALITWVSLWYSASAWYHRCCVSVEAGCTGLWYHCGIQHQRGIIGVASA